MPSPSPSPIPFPPPGSGSGSDIVLSLRNKWSDTMTVSGRSKKSRKNKTGFSKSQHEKNKYALAKIEENKKGRDPKSTNLFQKQIEKYESEEHIYDIKSLENLEFDLHKILGFKKGDLNLIQSRTVRCKAYGYARRLVLKSMDCMDQSVYNLKVHETDCMLRFTNHPNIIKLYSYWSTASESPFVYKELYQIFEESTLGDIDSTIISSTLKPSIRTVMKYICDIAKGLTALHTSDIIHGGIRPSNLLLSANNDLKVGALKKTELESLRKMRHLISKFCIERFMKLYFIYWAPEIFQDQAIQKGSDVWSLGVVAYILLMGEYPFEMLNQEQCIQNILNANVSYRKMENMPRVQVMLRGIFLIDPEQRWTAERVLQHCQEDFAIVIQRFWRGSVSRIKFRKKCTALVRIQANFRGWLIRTRFRKRRIEIKHRSAVVIQRRWRNYSTSKFYRRIRKLIMRLQANVLTRQVRRAFLKLKKDTILAQAFVRRFLAYSSFHCLKMNRAELLRDLGGISSRVTNINQQANLYFARFDDSQPQAIISRNQNEVQNLGGNAGHGGNSLQVNQYGVKKYNQNQNDPYNDPKLKNELGNKYEEFRPKVEEIKNQLKHANQLMKASKPLPITFIRKRTQDIWQQTHEPFNLVDNVLRDDNQIYRNLKPTLEFSLDDEEECYVSEVIVHSDEPQPGDIEINMALGSSNDWRMVLKMSSTRDTIQHYKIPDEQYGRFLQIRFLNSRRGGNFIGVRYIQIMGIKKKAILF